MTANYYVKERQLLSVNKNLNDILIWDWLSFARYLRKRGYNAHWKSWITQPGFSTLYTFDNHVEYSIETMREYLIDKGLFVIETHGKEDFTDSIVSVHDFEYLTQAGSMFFYIKKG